MRRADRRHDLPGWAPVTLVILAALTVVVGLIAAWQREDTQTQNERLDAILAAVTVERDSAAGTVQDLATLIRGACDTGTIPGQYAAACLRAAEVQADPITVTVPAPGRAGTNGVAGLTPPCYFEAAMCRGADSTVPGRVGDQGPKGDQGTPGRDGLNGCDAGSSRDPDTQACTPVPAPPPAEPEG